MVVGVCVCVSLGGLFSELLFFSETGFRTEDNTRDLDKETSYSKLVVKAMKINTFYKGK